MVNVMLPDSFLTIPVARMEPTEHLLAYHSSLVSDYTGISNCSGNIQWIHST